jgi:putative SOS response-associated peptidase YedK
MCNNYASHVPPADLFEVFGRSRFPLAFPDGVPNLEPGDDIRPTDLAPVTLREGEASRLVRVKWGLDPSQPKRPPIINLRSEGRRLERGRCLIPASSFFEFTGTKYPKTRWRFSRTDGEWFCFGGVVTGSAEAMRFAILTCEPGPDISPIHSRQPVVLERGAWDGWLAGEPAAIEASPAGTWQVAEAPREKRLL